MNAMEHMALNMLQKMTGLSPDDMQRMSTKAIELLTSFDARMSVIENELTEIRELLTKDSGDER